MSEAWSNLAEMLRGMMGLPRNEGDPTHETERHEQELAKKRPHKRTKPPRMEPVRCTQCRAVVEDHYAWVDSRAYCLACAREALD